MVHLLGSDIDTIVSGRCKIDELLPWSSRLNKGEEVTVQIFENLKINQCTFYNYHGEQVLLLE